MAAKGAGAWEWSGKFTEWAFWDKRKVTQTAWNIIPSRAELDAKWRDKGNEGTRPKAWRLCQEDLNEVEELHARESIAPQQYAPHEEIEIRAKGVTFTVVFPYFEFTFGNREYVVDMTRKLQINRKTGFGRSITQHDRHGWCFADDYKLGEWVKLRNALPSDSKWLYDQFDAFAKGQGETGAPQKLSADLQAMVDDGSLTVEQAQQMNHQVMELGVVGDLQNCKVDRSTMMMTADLMDDDNHKIEELQFRMECVSTTKLKKKKEVVLKHKFKHLSEDMIHADDKNNTLNHHMFNDPRKRKNMVDRHNFQPIKTKLKDQESQIHKLKEILTQEQSKIMHSEKQLKRSISKSHLETIKQAHDTEVQQLGKEVESVQTKLSDKEKALSEQTTALQGCRAELETSTRDYNQTITTLRQTEAQLRAAEMEATQARSELEILNTRLQDRDRAHTAATGGLQGQVDTLHAQLEDQRAGWNSERDTLLQQLQQLRDELHDSKSETSMVVVQASDLQTQLEAASQDAATKQSRLVELETDVERLKRSGAEMQGQVQTLRAARDSLDKEHNSLQVKSAQYEEELQRVNEDFVSLQKEAAQERVASEAQVSLLESQVVTMRARLDDGSVAGAQHKEQILELQAELKTARTGLLEAHHALKAAKEGSREAREDHTKIETDLKAMVSDLQQQAISLNTAVAERDADVKSTKGRVDQLEGQLKEARDARDAAETQVHALEAKSEHQSNELGRMMERCQELEDQNKQVEASRAQAEEQHQRDVNLLSGQYKDAKANVAKLQDQVQHMEGVRAKIDVDFVGLKQEFSLQSKRLQGQVDEERATIQRERDAHEKAILTLNEQHKTDTEAARAELRSAAAENDSLRERVEQNKTDVQSLTQKIEEISGLGGDEASEFLGDDEDAHTMRIINALECLNEIDAANRNMEEQIMELEEENDQLNTSRNTELDLLGDLHDQLTKIESFSKVQGDTQLGDNLLIQHGKPELATPRGLEVYAEQNGLPPMTGDDPSRAVWAEKAEETPPTPTPAPYVSKKASRIIPDGKWNRAAAGVPIADKTPSMKQ